MEIIIILVVKFKRVGSKWAACHRLSMGSKKEKGP